MKYPSFFILVVLLSWRFAHSHSHAFVGSPTITRSRSRVGRRIHSSSGEEEKNELLLNELRDDFKALTELRPPIPTADISFPAEVVSDGSSYTRIWTAQTWATHSHPPHRRYFRHVRKWTRSKTARKVLPTVCLATCWSLVVTLLARYFEYRPIPRRIISVVGTSSAVSLLSAPLALLLTLRANSSVARLLESRQAWGKLVLHSRGLASILANYVYPINPQAAVLSVRYLVIIGWILKGQFRGESEANQESLLKLMLTPQEYKWIMKEQSSPKYGVAILSRIRQICTLAIISSSTAKVSPNHLYFIEDRLKELETSAGICERLYGSPIPPTYTRHLSRVMSLWLLLLPVSLVSTIGPTSTAIITTTLAAYVFVGLDEVGMEIENCFQLLPLQQLAAAVQKDSYDQFYGTVVCSSPPEIDLHQAANIK
jgi:putative membrane protein